MGGTETNQALCGAYRIGKPDGRMQRIKKNVADKVRSTFAADTSNVKAQPQILLITDGEVWDHQQIVKDAVASKHRVFTVGVGMAVAEGLVTELAKGTGGACELVSPQEGMTEIILGQFHRMRQPKIRQANIAFDVTPAWATPLPATLFAGDTVHVFAGFDESTPQRVVLNAIDDSDTALVAEDSWKLDFAKPDRGNRPERSPDHLEMFAMASPPTPEHTPTLTRRRPPGNPHQMGD